MLLCFVRVCVKVCMKVWTLLWMSVSTERRESVPLQGLWVEDMTARLKLSGETSISNCPWLFSRSEVTSPPSLLCLCWSPQQLRGDSPGPSCVSMKSDMSMEQPITFKDGQKSSGRRWEGQMFVYVSMPLFYPSWLKMATKVTESFTDILSLKSSLWKKSF